MRQVYFSGLLASLVPFWFFPATQIIENLPAELVFSHQVYRAGLSLLVGLCCYVRGFS